MSIKKLIFSRGLHNEFVSIGTNEFYFAFKYNDNFNSQICGDPFSWTINPFQIVMMNTLKDWIESRESDWLSDGEFPLYVYKEESPGGVYIALDDGWYTIRLNVLESEPPSDRRRFKIVSGELVEVKVC